MSKSNIQSASGIVWINHNHNNNNNRAWCDSNEKHLEIWIIIIGCEFRTSAARCESRKENCERREYEIVTSAVCAVGSS